MKFIYESFDENDASRGGVLHVHCDTSSDVVTYFNIRSGNADPDEVFRAQLALRGQGYFVGPLGKPDYAYFPVTVTLESAWLAPYNDRLRSRTGYDGPLPDLPLPSLRELCHTVAIDKVAIDGGQLIVECFDSAGDYNGRPAAKLVTGYARRAVLDKFAETIVPREYIECRDGCFKRNPEFGDGKHRVRPGVHNRKLWKALCDWWLETEATPWQRQIIEQEREDKVVKGVEGYLGFYGEPYHVFTRDYGPEGYVTREQFIRGGEDKKVEA